MAKPQLPQVALGECVDILSGFAFDASLFNGEEGIPVVRIRDVTRGHTETYYSGEYEEKFLLCDGDLLVGMDGEFNLGVWSGGMSLINQRVCKITANNSLLDSSYLKHFLPNELKKIESVTSFATVKHLSVRTIRDIQIRLPEIAEQRRIAAILDEAQLLNITIREVLLLLDELETSLFETAFASRDQYKKMRLMEVCRPKQWPVISMKELKEDGYTVFGANGPIGFFDTYTHIEPTIAITCRGATCGTVNITPPEAYINGNAMALDNLNTDLVTLEFLAASLKARGFADVISGSAQPQITREGLSKVSISVPPLNEQIMFSVQVKTVNELRIATIEQRRVVDELVLSLQDRAFKGEL